MSSSRFPAVVDDVTVRLIAAVVLVIGVIALATQQWWLYAVLAVDFSLRAALGPQASPIARLVQRWIRPAVSAPKRPTAGPPKRFAATIGAVMTVAATVLWVVALVTGSSGATAGVVVIGAVMVLFPALESIFGICVGCILFSGLMRLGVIPEEVCLECADITKRRDRLVAERTGQQAA
ncbi:DUF4395 domain-containing protein [Terrabacter sp. Root181]|jgi:hypothetical protein|uniref:DUF4395 domain-containing protein n=1 Tax=Terrabacter sp. Root181 TaxID=1736484 RepID=UPI0006F4233E|nr:DUF4395 domain-containing protein [Terrabacter sp. Root181]KRB47248.1 hypothetical protein ASD90_02435 [Terrabacter sp. Root181]